MKETNILQAIRMACSRGAVRLFRNQVGTYKLADGRCVSSGLAVGSADLIGWRTIEVTPDMIGRRIAVFASVEVKAESGKVRPEQKAWSDAVIDAGGIAGIVRSVEEAQRLLYNGQPLAPHQG